MRHRIVIALFSLLLPAAGFGQSAFVDPGIPDNETLLYTATRDKETYPLTERTARKTENGRPIYEVTVESSREDYRLKLDEGTMAVFYSWRRSSRPELVTETETKIVKNEILDKPGEATLVDFVGLEAILRGFPFDSVRSLKLKTAEGSDFALTLAQTNETDVKTAAGAIRCYELDSGWTAFSARSCPRRISGTRRRRRTGSCATRGRWPGPARPRTSSCWRGPGRTELRNRTRMRKGVKQ